MSPARRSECRWLASRLRRQLSPALRSETSNRPSPVMRTPGGFPPGVSIRATSACARGSRRPWPLTVVAAVAFLVRAHSRSIRAVERGRHLPAATARRPTILPISAGASDGALLRKRLGHPHPGPFAASEGASPTERRKRDSPGGKGHRPQESTSGRGVPPEEASARRRQRSAAISTRTTERSAYKNSSKGIVPDGPNTARQSSTHGLRAGGKTPVGPNRGAAGHRLGWNGVRFDRPASLRKP
jgi:hypothetical protein